MTIIATVLALAALLVAALLSALETALLLVPVVRARRMVEAEGKRAVAFEALIERVHRVRAASALAQLFAAGAAAGAAIAWMVALRQSGIVWLLPHWSFAVGAAGLSLAVELVAFSFASGLPRTVAAANPERIALDLAPLAAPLVRIIYPLARFVSLPWRWGADVIAHKQTPSPWTLQADDLPDTEDALREQVAEDLLEAVSDFTEKVVREVMVPRTDVSALPDTATLTEAAALIGASGYSRVPVYHESIDDICGVLYAKDLLAALQGKQDATPSSLARPPYFVPETKPVDELLREMRTRTHIAIVADEYGGTAGIVTLEDLLEEIVGDISDEYDQVETLIEAADDGALLVDARLPVDDLNELLGTDFETEADSVGGFVTELFGTIPEVGAAGAFGGVSIEVIEREGTRVRKLLVRPIHTANEETEDEHPDAT